jgi:hypothetical protein
MSTSEIARLRLQIEEICQAMQQGLTGYAITASHAVISHHYQQLETCTRQLEHVVGVEEATHLMCEMYNKIIEKEEDATS